MAARWQGVNATPGQGHARYAIQIKLRFDPPLSVSICVYLWIHSANSNFMKIDRINHSDDGGVDGRVGTADSGHGGKTFHGEQDAVADARAHRVEREDRIAAIGAVEVKRLDDEDLAPVVGRDLLGRDNVSDYAANEHTRKCRRDGPWNEGKK